jgi:glycosyltransferase involved in cell wall biosynthesis
MGTLGTGLSAAHVLPVARRVRAPQAVRRLLSPLVQPAAFRREYRVSVTPNAVPGINVVGYFRAELGIAEVARQIVRSVERAAIPYSAVTYERTLSRQEHPFGGPDSQEAPYDTNIICVNADQLPYFRRDVGEAFFRGRHSIGVWFWELGRFPSGLRPALDLVDEVWAASEFVRGAIAAATNKPVHVIPLPIGDPTPVTLSRDQLNLPKGFLFLFSFDFLSIVERKNPLAVVQAFKRAFRHGEGAALLIKTVNGPHAARALRRLQAAAADHPDIHVVDGYVSASIKDATIAACDCYVSLHRSEGFGLTMAEAMAYGKPVIATAYSGNLDFMDDANSFLVPFRLTKIARRRGPYSAAEQWADPDVAVAAQLMRHVYDHPDEGRAVGDTARLMLRTHYTLQRTGSFVAKRLAEQHRLASHPSCESV